MQLTQQKKCAEINFSIMSLTNVALARHVSFLFAVVALMDLYGHSQRKKLIKRPIAYESDW